MMRNRIKISKRFPYLLTDHGLDPSLIAQRAGLGRDFFQQDQLVLTAEQWFTCWNTIAALTNDPLLALRLGSANRIERYDPSLITALSSRTLHEAFSNLMRYKHITCSEHVALIPEQDIYRIEVSWPVAEERPPDLLIDTTFTAFVQLVRLGTNQSIQPKRLFLQRSSAPLAAFEQFFGCPIILNAETNALCYSAEDMHQPFVTANPELLEILLPQLELALSKEQSQPQITDQVRAVVRQRIAGRRPDIQDIASELAMSARSLQRKLAEEGSSYQQLLDHVRRELAFQYLQGSSMELNEIAYLLGYEETSSFHRAFQHWAGTTPGQWRKSMTR